MSRAASYRHGRAIARHHGTTFFLAARLLPADRRRHVHALYALARTADDLVDEARPGSDPSAALDGLEQALHRSIGADRDDPVIADPVVDAAADTIRAFDIPRHCFDRFFASMRQDLVVASYERWDDLLGYMDGSAAAIGEMLLPVLDPRDHDAALAPARSLGLAFQLTNFLRDVGEDLARGRQYLPREDLRRFGVELADRRVTPGFVELMRFEFARCRALYGVADGGLPLLPRRSRLAIGAARTMYAAILDAIESSGFDVFDRRATVSRAKRLRLLTGTTARLWR